MPDSCRRAVEGSVTYQVIGWYTASGHLGYLAPMTLINLASLFIIIMTMHKANGRTSADDPTDLERLLAATRSPAEGNDVTDKVVYQPRAKQVHFLSCCVTLILRFTDVLKYLWFSETSRNL